MRKAKINYEYQGVTVATILFTVEDIHDYQKCPNNNLLEMFPSVVDTWHKLVDEGEYIIVNSVGGYFNVDADTFFQEYLVEWVEE